MIDHVPRFFILVTSIFLGPIHARGFPAFLTPLLIILTLTGLSLAITHKRSFQRRSIALLSVLVLMFCQDLLLIIIGLHMELFHPDLLASSISYFFFSTIFKVNLGLAIVGVIGAVSIAAYVEFGRSRKSLTELFPEYRFLKAPPRVQQMVRRLAATAGVQPPQVRLLDSGIPWAFITRARHRFVLAVSVGLLESLEPAEIEACVAHEISHLKNKDFVLRFSATMAKIGLFARPLSYLLEPAIYRAREHLADDTASKLVGGPNALVSALSKIREAHYEMATPSSIEIACLFHSGGGRLSRVFNKQPTLESRIRALKELQLEKT